MFLRRSCDRPSWLCAQADGDGGAAADAGGGAAASGGRAEAESVSGPEASAQREVASSQLPERLLPEGAAEHSAVRTLALGVCVLRAPSMDTSSDRLPPPHIHIDVIFWAFQFNLDG